MTIRLEGEHRAVVVGLGAIGAAVCEAYVAAGATILGLDVDPEGAQRVVDGLRGSGHHAAALDVRDLADVRAAAVLAGRDGISSLCFAAGVVATFEVLEFDWSAYRRIMSVNLDGALHVASAFGAEMVRAGAGSMSFISSIAGRRGEAGAAAYCASKFALRGVVESFAGEVGAHGVRVNTICPGEVDTPMLAQVARAQAQRHGTTAAEELERMSATAALRRLVSPREVAETAVWLASAGASAITGASIDVTAGLGAV